MQVALVERVIARLRAAGITVHEVPGWRTRARPGAWEPRGLLVHHTAIRASYARPAAGLRTCVDGRADLPGPLCQTLGAYDGAVHVISAGRANHAGKARPSGPIPGGNGNVLYWGHEIDYYPDAPMSPEQYRAAVMLGAIVADELGGGPELVRAHAETSVTGKWDPGHALPNRTIDMAKFRRDVAAHTSREGIMAGLSDAEQRELLAAVRDLRDLRFPGYPPDAPHPGGAVNAILSVWRQTFFDTPLGDALVGEVDAAALAQRIVDAGVGQAVADELAHRLGGGS